MNQEPAEGKIILDAEQIRRALTRIGYEILERNGGVDGLLLVGVKTRGAYLAQRLAERLLASEGTAVAVLELDARPFRDDRRREPAAPPAPLSRDITGQRIVLVDDVLYTGRTARAAIEALISAGRPAGIQLAVLVDRGHRELPIRADYVGKNVPTARQERVAVRLREVDGADEVRVVRAGYEL